MTPHGRAYRLASLDMLRGLVIVVMAIDHVRDYFNFGGESDPMANPGIGAALFFTRWITHFCAPVFVFLAGTSAGLMAARKTPSALGAFLFKRGVWLIVIEWCVVATAWMLGCQVPTPCGCWSSPRCTRSASGWPRSRAVVRTGG